jgi:hypothetical protein
MKRSLSILATATLLAAGAARADAYEAPAAHDEPAAETAVNLCEHKAVREVAKVEKKLKPVKDIANAIANPTGFALRMVNDHVVHIPKWVGIAMDPEGYVRGKVIERVRHEAKKAVGVHKGCADEIGGEPVES